MAGSLPARSTGVGQPSSTLAAGLTRRHNEAVTVSEWRLSGQALALVPECAKARRWMTFVGNDMRGGRA